MQHETDAEVINRFTDMLKGQVDNPVQQQMIEYLERHKHDIDAPEPHDPDLIDLIREALIAFEELHPKTTSIIGKISDHLSKMGI